MKTNRIFKNKLSFSRLNEIIDYYAFERGKRVFNGKQRYGYYYVCDKLNKAALEKYDNVIFLQASTQYAPEIKKQAIFVFD